VPEGGDGSGRENQDWQGRREGWQGSALLVRDRSQAD
jgi:hypothetical protein